jgi:hypothetical protein
MSVETELQFIACVSEILREAAIAFPAAVVPVALAAAAGKAMAGEKISRGASTRSIRTSRAMVSLFQATRGRRAHFALTGGPPSRST